jgi:glutathionylspermidine synthase
MIGSMNMADWCGVVPLPADALRDLRRRAIFECCKWDPQVEDVETLAPMVVVMKPSVWRHLATAAEALAAETMRLEHALLEKPDLHHRLALPRAIEKLLAARFAQTGRGNGHRDVRVMRFDFHPTEEGWRVSEANTDVPGGYNEASGWTSLVASHVPEARLAGNPAEALASAIAERVQPGGTVALVHATSYTDDRQVMIFLGRYLEAAGLQTVMAAPDHIRWHHGRAVIETEWFSGPADFVFRFFPAEWLPNLGRDSDWRGFFTSEETPQCNPATALLSQSKRWPLLHQELGLDLPAWTRLLPETVDPRDVEWREQDDWVVKPAMGRVGESVGLNGVTEPKEWKALCKAIRWHEKHWVAQRRFRPMPLSVAGQTWHVCLGVYTVAGRAAGIYGRISDKPLINHLARDVAVLVGAE